MADNIKTARAIKENGRENLRKVSISRIKKEMNDVFYLSDDLVITTLSAQNNTTAEYPASIDGFSAIIMMTGEATVSIDMQNYSVKPNTIVFFNPDSIIRTVKCSANAVTLANNVPLQDVSVMLGQCRSLFPRLLQVVRQRNPD